MDREGNGISVVICAYADERWKLLQRAVASVESQTRGPRETIVVVDHNDRLLERAIERFSNAIVVANPGCRGLASARNAGLGRATGDVVAFLDDDAFATCDWLDRLNAWYALEDVIGVGGAVHPLWPTGRQSRPPAEFHWVIGCSYRGMPTGTERVRNFIGANMSFRRSALLGIDGFRTHFGRIGRYPAGCEETDVCIRLMARRSEGMLVYEPRAVVYHHVSEQRCSLGYFAARCYAEGLSKARLAADLGASGALASERVYATRVLPRGVASGLVDLFRGDRAGGGRVALIALGLSTTAAGYAVGRARLADKRLTRIRLPSRVAGWSLLAKAESFEPVLMVERDLALTTEPVDGRRGDRQYNRALCLVRRNGDPLGMLSLDLHDGAVSRSELLGLMEGAFGEHTLLRTSGLKGPRSSSPKPSPLVSIVVPTRNRPAVLERTLACLASLDYPKYEVLIVENVPVSSATRELVEHRGEDFFRLRYLREDHPGQSWARNSGLAAVSTPIVAFVDDDVLVDRRWLSALVDSFYAADDVGCVTGLILPAELETRAQALFEEYGGFNKGFERRIFDLGDNRPDDPLFPFTAGRLGSGASMAFSADVLRDVGGFDLPLGTGSPPSGGEDLTAFRKVILAGHRLVYQPAAIAYHPHPRSDQDLVRQVFRYGRGLGAYTTACVVEDPALLRTALGSVPAALRHLFSTSSERNRARTVAYPRRLVALEAAGLALGPLTYARGRCAASALLRERERAA